MLSRLGQLYRCVRHVPSRQLRRRLYLTGKRQLLCHVPRFLKRRRRQTLPLAAHPPQPVFAPKAAIAECESGRWFVRLLGRTFSLDAPVDWRLRNAEPTTHLERLEFHYHEVLAALPAATGQRLILDWIDQNPPWQRGYWLDSWNCYAISIRCVCWMQWLVRDDVVLCDGDSQTILGSLCEQLRFLTHNLETDICGNHLIKNIRCLLWASSFFEGDEAVAWAGRGNRLLQQEVDKQFLSDGMHFELSPAYHCQVFGDLMDCASALPAYECKRLLQQLEPAAECLQKLTHPDGLISLFSDGGLHMAYSPAELLSVWERLGGTHISGTRCFDLREAGYFGWRGTRSSLLVDCGPVCADALPAHGHADMLSFEWDVDLQRIIVDAGVYQYEPGPNRIRDRSVVSHNTVSIGEREQCELIGSFRTGRRTAAVCELFESTDERFRLVGSHDGFSTAGDALTHRRLILATNKSLRIEDEVTGRGIGERAVARFLLHDACTVDQNEPGCIMVKRGRSWIRMESSSGISTRDTFWSPDFGVRLKTVQIEIAFGPVPASLVTEFHLEPVLS